MRKTNAALLEEIAELEKACLEKNEELTQARRLFKHHQERADMLQTQLSWHMAMNNMLGKVVERLTRT